MLKKEFPNLNFIKKEIEDVPGVITNEKPDLIYHFAAQVGVTASVQSPIRDFQINAAGTFYITQAAGKIPIAPYALPGSLEMGTAIEPLLSKHRIIILNLAYRVST